MDFGWPSFLICLGLIVSKNTEVVGMLLEVKSVWGDASSPAKTILATLQTREHGQLTIKGRDDDLTMEKGTTYRLWGNWTEYHNRYSGKSERQFTFQNFTETTPVTGSQIELYLQRRLGLTKAVAAAIVENFDEDSLEALRSRTQEVREALAAKNKRLNLDGLELAAEKSKADKNKESATIELIDLFAGRFFPAKTVNHCISRWGVHAPQQIKADPYVLLDIKGIGFARADKLYCDLGHDRNALRRQVLCACHSIRESRSGSTWFSRDEVHQFINAAIGSVYARPAEAIQLGLVKGFLQVTWTDRQGDLDELGECYWYTVNSYATDEAAVAEICKEKMRNANGKWDVGIVDESDGIGVSKLHVL